VPIASALALCLSGSRGPECFSGSRVVARDVVASAIGGAPLGLVAAVSGSTVGLSWSAPISPVGSYLIEAGSTAGSANLANLSGSPTTSYIATDVGAGTYYVRGQKCRPCWGVRSVGTAGDVSSPSNEVVIVVGGNGPCTPPGAPSGLTVVAVTGGTVSLSWAPGAGSPTTYIVEAGTGPGLANLVTSDVGSPKRVQIVLNAIDGRTDWRGRGYGIAIATSFEVPLVPQLLRAVTRTKYVPLPTPADTAPGAGLPRSATTRSDSPGAEPTETM
jgi:hypothetical protein